MTKPRTALAAMLTVVVVWIGYLLLVDVQREDDW